MAAKFGGTNAIKRLTNVVSGTSDYSCVFWLRLDAAPTGGAFDVPFITKTTAYTDYYRLKTDINSILVGATAKDAANPEGSTITKSFTIGDWFCVAYVRDIVSDVHRLYVQGSGAGNIFSVNLPALDEIWLGSDGIRFSPCAVAYFREWDKVMSLTELKAELRSPVAVDSVNLITDTPLTSDLLDVSGNGNDWVSDGAAPSFEANPTQSVLSYIEFAIGASIRTSYAKLPNTASPTTPGGSRGLTIFGIANGQSQSIVNLIFGSTQAPGSSTHATGGIYDAIYANVCLEYFTGGITYARPVLEFPFADPYLGQLATGTYPRINWATRIWKMRCRTSTFDFLVGDPVNPFSSGYSADGEIEVIVDGITLFSVSGVNIKRCKTDWFTNVIKPLVYPCGDMDSLWICNTNAYPTIAGAQNAPSGANLQEYLDFNASSAPGWTDTKLFSISMLGVLYNATSGLDGTVGICTNNQDIATSASLTGVAPNATPYGAITRDLTLIPSSAAVGTIIVEKVTLPADTTSFDFTAGGGLSPASFSLQNGQSQTFNNVPVGNGYSIAETIDPDYLTVEYLVSNGSPVDNISVSDGEIVTITVTNKRNGRIVIGKVSDPFSGAEEFTLNINGGLTPSSFVLISDGEQIFEGVAAGIYELTEDAEVDYSPLFLISNDPTNDNLNILVEPGLDTIIMVLNNLQARYSGLYQIVPSKTSDTVIDQGFDESDVAIPNPYAETALIGDE